MPRSEPPRKADPWDAAEDAYLLTQIDDGVGWPEIAASLKRSRGQCMTRAGGLLLAQLVDGEPDSSELTSHVNVGRESSSWAIEDEGRLMAGVVGGKNWDEVALDLQRQPASCRTRAQVIALNQYVADLQAGTPTEASLRASSWRLEI